MKTTVKTTITRKPAVRKPAAHKASSKVAKDFDTAVRAKVLETGLALNYSRTVATRAANIWIEQLGAPTVAAVIGLEGSNQRLNNAASREQFAANSTIEDCEELIEALQRLGQPQPVA